MSETNTATPRTHADYLALVLTHDCRWCGKRLPKKIDQYPHSDGWPVVGEEKKQWLSIHCGCGYDWSLSKLGVPR